MFLNELTSSQVKQAVETCMKARLVPFIQSSPGMGKSALVKQIAEEWGLKLIDLRLSAMDPVDLMGLPWIQDGKAKFNPFEMFPVEGTDIPKGYSGWCLFLDEFNSANRAVQAAAYRLVLDREVGNHKLHEKCLVVAAGNLASDNAIVNKLSTAMLSRVVHLNMKISFEDWMYNFAIPNGVDPRIVAYLNMYPSKLMEFDPEKDDQTFTCPRTWSFVSMLIKANGGVVNNDTIPLLAGAITLAQASAFVQYCQSSANLVTYEQIIANPNIEPPKDLASQWATITHLILKTNETNFAKLSTFINKMPATLQVVYVRSMKKLYTKLLLVPEFTAFIKTLGGYALGD